eukprot:5740101-Amphidinium_carterae.1
MMHLCVQGDAETSVKSPGTSTRIKMCVYVTLQVKAATGFLQEKRALSDTYASLLLTSVL